ERRASVCLACRRHGRACEASDEIAGEVLQTGEIPARPIEGPHPHRLTGEPVERIGEALACVVVADPLLDASDKRVVLRRVGQLRHVQIAVDDRVLEIVHGVGDVVGEVHDLRLDAPQPP
ncbi:hypothetical protein ABE10_00125, partial [Bacillus toyonensis]|nr:hypothetical protein [Bacillus toyonensis]